MMSVVVQVADSFLQPGRTLLVCIGQVNRVGDSFIRPHDVEIWREPSPAREEAIIERLVYLGFEVRVELRRADGHALHAQISREEAKRLRLRADERVYISLGRATVFHRPREPLAV